MRDRRDIQARRLLYAACSRVEWATLLARTFEVDVTVCVRCGGRLAVRAVVAEPDSGAKILAALSRTRPTLASSLAVRDGPARRLRLPVGAGV